MSSRAWCESDSSPAELGMRPPRGNIPGGTGHQARDWEAALSKMGAGAPMTGRPHRPGDQ